MKKVLLALAFVVLMASSVMAAGSCVLKSSELVYGNNSIQKKIVKLTCTGDGSITAYSFDPGAYGVRGWYLYSVTTDPGTAPTADYDITLVVNGEDIAGGLLADRSASATETVAISPTTLGYPILDEAIAITFANNTANPSDIVLTLKFTDN
jgi:P pilus assembly chaperone PapD